MPLIFSLGGLNIEGEDESYDFGSGAGFYIDATKEPWNKGYNMYSYITKELPEALFSQFKELDSSRVSITGHSMGGHGALTLFLKNPGKYKSVSAFAPIANPINAPWGQKAFKGYIGENQEEWKQHDATELVKQWKGPLEILIDVVRPHNTIYRITLMTGRALATTSTSRSSCYRKISLKQPNKPVMTRAFSFACSPTTTTAITSWPHSRMIMLNGQQST